MSELKSILSAVKSMFFLLDIFQVVFFVCLRASVAFCASDFLDRARSRLFVNCFRHSSVVGRVILKSIWGHGLRFFAGCQVRAKPLDAAAPAASKTDSPP